MKTAELSSRLSRTGDGSSSDSCSRVIHDQLVRIAEPMSTKLTEALRSVGPVDFPDRRGQGMAFFLSRAVVGQQLSTKAARSIWSRIVQAAEEDRTEIPEFFSTSNHRRLRACGVSASKAKALLAISEANDAGRLSDMRLNTLSDEEKSRELLRLHGVGPWTCDMALIFYFRHTDIWPEGDASVQREFGRLIGRRDLNKTAAKFSPYRSYVALSMWRLIDGQLGE